MKRDREARRKLVQQIVEGIQAEGIYHFFTVMGVDASDAEMEALLGKKFMQALRAFTKADLRFHKEVWKLEKEETNS